MDEETFQNKSETIKILVPKHLSDI
jgi:hypothetical protein